MAKKLKATPPELFMHAMHVYDQFAAGRAATLRLDKHDAVVYLVPTRLMADVVDDGAEREDGLLIVQQGKGSYVWDGRDALNGYELVSARFSLATAMYVAEIVNAVMHKMRSGIDPIKQLGNPQEK